jgi:hypothetical protein
MVEYYLKGKSKIRVVGRVKKLVEGKGRVL